MYKYCSFANYILHNQLAEYPQSGFSIWVIHSLRLKVSMQSTKYGNVNFY